jgi:hypothetical protein
MAAFDNSTSIYLNFGSKPFGKSRPVLWPVLVHRILYPEIQKEKINLFQKVVMRLVRAKVNDVEELASLTGFHNNLVLLILAQLIGHGWLTDDVKELTVSGVKVINEEDEQSEQLASGYLFQDAVTGKLWPRIENRLALVEPIDQREKFPKFDLNRKTGKLLNPYKPFFKPSNCTRPSSANTLHAWQEYRSDYRAARQLAHFSDLPKQVKLSAITYQSEQPESAWVMVWITASNNSKLWSIKDPFDIRDEAWFLNDSFPHLLESDKNFTKTLANLIDKPVPDEQSVSEWLASLQDQAELQVLLDYPWAKYDPDITAALAVLLKRREMLESGQDYKNDLEAAITEAQKLLEVLMQWLIVSYPAEGGTIPKPGKNNWNLNERVLEVLQLPAFNKEVRRALSRQNLQSVARCLNSPVSSLKALLFAAALGSVGNADHPLKSLSDKQLKLSDLLQLADLRNQTSHGNSQHTGKKYTEITTETARKYIDYALQFTEKFKEWINGEKETS